MVVLYLKMKIYVLNVMNFIAQIKKLGNVKIMNKFLKKKKYFITNVIIQMKMEMHAKNVLRDIIQMTMDYVQMKSIVLKRMKMELAKNVINQKLMMIYIHIV